jgi:tetratricopeptide (TPR) repeat protein
MKLSTPKILNQLRFTKTAHVLLVAVACVQIGCGAFHKTTSFNADARKYMSKSLDAAEVNDSEQAIAMVSKAIELDDEYIRAIDWRATLYRGEGHKVMKSGNDVEKAKMYYQKAKNDYLRLHQLEPKNVDPLLSIASIYEDLVEYPKAGQYIDEALKIDPDNHNAKSMKEGLTDFLNKQRQGRENGVRKNNTVAAWKGHMNGVKSCEVG